MPNNNDFAGGAFGIKQDFTVSSGGTDVTSAAVIPANRVVIGDDGAYGVKAAIASINDAGGYSSTIAAAGNSVALSLTQNDTTNNLDVVQLTNATTSNDIQITDSGAKGSSNSGAGALLINMTHATDVGIVANIRAKNTGTTGNLIRANSFAAFTTTVAGAQTISTASTQLTVTSTSGFPSSGTVRISNSTSTTESALGAMIHYTSVDATHFIGSAGVFYKCNTSINVIDLAQVDYIDSTQTASIIESLDNNSNGGMVNMKLTGLNPDLEFISKSGYDSANGEGKFEIDVPTGDNVTRTATDCIRINGRRDANNGFDVIAVFTRPGPTRHGLVGIGFQNLTDPITLEGHLHVKNDAGEDAGAAAIITSIFQGAAAQTANLTEWRNDSGTVLASVGPTGALATTIASSANVVGLTVVQNDTVNNTRAVSVTNTGTGATLFVDANGNSSVSTSVGGAVLIENTGNLGSAMVIYSNAGASTSGARLLSLRADNVLFDQAVMAISNDGTGAALSINGTGGTGVGVTISTAGTGTNHSLGVNYTGTSATGAAGSFTSTNTAFTTLQISGHEFGHGTIKLSHVGDGASSDVNAAGISIDLQNSDAGTGTTAAQAIFITSTTGGTTGKLANWRNNLLAFGGADAQVELFTVTGDGRVGIGRATPTGKFDMAGALTVASGASAVLDDFALQASTITITGSTNITTAAGFNFASFGQPTYTAVSAVAITIGSTVYIKNAPAVTGSATLTTPLALWVDDGNVRFDGNLSVAGTISGPSPYTAYSSGPQTLTTSQRVIESTSGTFTVNLPTAVGITGTRFEFKQSGTGVLTIDANSSETIDGQLTWILNSQYSSVTVISNGANWLVF